MSREKLITEQAVKKAALPVDSLSLDLVELTLLPILKKAFNSFQANKSRGCFCPPYYLYIACNFTRKLKQL